MEGINITSICTTIVSVLGTPIAYALDKLNFY